MRVWLVGMLAGCGFHGGSKAGDGGITHDDSARPIDGGVDAARDAFEFLDAPSAQTTFVFEAEAYSGTQVGTGDTRPCAWGFSNDAAAPGFSSTGYLLLSSTPTGDGQGCTPSTLGSCAIAGYDVTIQEAGTYYLHFRAFATSTSNDSVYAGMDGAATATANGIGIPHDAWSWLPPASFTLAAGAHVAQLWQRESGARVDMVVLSMSAGDPALP